MRGVGEGRIRLVKDFPQAPCLGERKKGGREEREGRRSGDRGKRDTGEMRTSKGKNRRRNAGNCLWLRALLFSPLSPFLGLTPRRGLKQNFWRVWEGRSGSILDRLPPPSVPLG